MYTSAQLVASILDPTLPEHYGIFFHRVATTDRSKSRKNSKGFSYFYYGSPCDASYILKYISYLLFTHKLLGIETGMLKCGYYSDVRTFCISNRNYSKLGNHKKKEEKRHPSVHYT